MITEFKVAVPCSDFSIFAKRAKRAPLEDGKTRRAGEENATLSFINSDPLVIGFVNAAANVAGRMWVERMIRACNKRRESGETLRRLERIHLPFGAERI